MKKLLMKTWTNSNGPLLLENRQTSLRKPLISLEFLKLLLQDFFSFFSVNHGLLVNCRFPYTLLVDSKQPQCSPQIEFIFSLIIIVKLALNKQHQKVPNIWQNMDHFRCCTFNLLFGGALIEMQHELTSISHGKSYPIT